VLGLLETRNLQFDFVYVLDVNEGVLPPGRSTDMLLPQSLRKMLKMETYHDREILSEYYFNLLVQGATHVHLFFNETPNGDRERSRFIQKLLWQEEQQAGKLLGERISSVRYRVQLANKTPMPLAKTDAVMNVLGSLEYSATLLDTYLQCPLRFYYYYVLGLREQDSVSDELEQLDVGTVIHKILYELFTPLVNQCLSEINLTALNVEDVVRQEVQKQFGSKLRGAQQLMLIQIQRQMKQFLMRYQIPIASVQETIVTGLEQDLRTFANGVALRAKCDRIEQRGATIHILDYKISGDGARYKVNWEKLDIHDRASWNNAVGSLQLPFYVRIYSLITNTPAEQIIPAYLFLGKNTIDENIETPLVPNDEDRGSCYRRSEFIIDGLINEIQNPAIGFEPPQSLSDACPQCPFTAICGTAWVQGWSGS
jgi:CRISPR/Cas system-associated exonuclease Cas4 (RecB family)